MGQIKKARMRLPISPSIVIETFLLSCTVSEILQAFVLVSDPILILPYFGVIPLDQIADVGISLSRDLKLFGCGIIFEHRLEYFEIRSFPAYVIPLLERHGQTDELLWHHCAMRSIAR